MYSSEKAKISWLWGITRLGAKENENHVVFHQYFTHILEYKQFILSPVADVPEFLVVEKLELHFAPCYPQQKGGFPKRAQN